MAITQYREHSEPIEIHSDKHQVCTHQDELEEGWECSCSYCRCESVIIVEAEYAYNEKHDHEVIIRISPGNQNNSSTVTLTAETARTLAYALRVAATDAETLNKEYPNE